MEGIGLARMHWKLRAWRLTVVILAVASCGKLVAGTTLAELTFPTEKLASAGRHTLSIGHVDFADYSFDTRGFDGGIPGPTFRIEPGETLLITLQNNLLAANNLACSQATDHFCETATTNLHTHGLHVSSKGRENGWTYYADDIFADVLPTESEDFRFAIPDYHMPGTHWYHPHHHHATALQAGGGAAGVLIVNDPAGYLPDIYANMPEKIMMISGHNLQTLQDMAQASDSTLLENAVNLANQANQATNVFLVNGQFGPQMTISSHTWHRFRIVYAAVEQSLDLSVSSTTNGASCTFQLMAKDGVYLHTFPRQVSTIHLFPGARSDVAASCTCTTYPCTATLGSNANRRLLRRMQGGKPGPGLGNGGAAPQNPGGDMATVDILELNIQETADGVTASLPSTSVTRPCYVVDLRGATIPNGQSGNLALQGGERRVQWNRQGASMTYDNVHANGGTKHTWPAITTFQSGTVYELTVQGAHAHPLHIHINPYQITSLPGGPYGTDDYFQVGDWHDTLMIPDLTANNDLGVRMQTDRFTGKMVIHCHILEHEDEGMMAWIDIDGTEGATWSGAESIDSTCKRSSLVDGSTTTTTTSSASSSTRLTSGTSSPTSASSSPSTSAGRSTTSLSSSGDSTTRSSSSSSQSSASTRSSVSSSAASASTQSSVSSSAASASTQSSVSSSQSSASTGSSSSPSSTTASTRSSSSPSSTTGSRSSGSNAGGQVEDVTTSTSTSSASSTTTSSSIRAQPRYTGVVEGTLTLDFASGSAADFLEAAANNSAVRSALKSAIAAPLASDGITAEEVRILSILSASSRRLIDRRPALVDASVATSSLRSSSSPASRILQAAVGVTVSYEVLVPSEASVSEDVLAATLQTSSSAVSITDALNQGLQSASLSVSVSTIEVTAAVAETASGDTTTPRGYARAANFAVARSCSGVQGMMAVALTLATLADARWR